MIKDDKELIEEALTRSVSTIYPSKEALREELQKRISNNKPLKISPKNKTSALQVKKTHNRGAVDKSTYASKSCASCGYNARHLHKFCPMCVLCKDCENKVMNCECRESE